jgi:acyl carrier protein
MELEAFVVDWTQFSQILARHARAETRLDGGVTPQTVLFGAGLDLSSVAFLESILEMEEDCGLEIDVESLDATIRTAGQLFRRLFPGQVQPPARNP